MDRRVLRSDNDAIARSDEPLVCFGTHFGIPQCIASTVHPLEQVTHLVGLLSTMQQ
jgi:hypothetical protein